MTNPPPAQVADHDEAGRPLYFCVCRRLSTGGLCGRCRWLEANSWPDGPRHLDCLGCGRRITSTSRRQRFCPGCRYLANRDNPVPHWTAGLR